MTRNAEHKFAARVSKALRGEEGAVSVEFAIVGALMLFLFFTLLDFGRVGFSQVMAEKAVQLAARTAAVRPPACAGVPETHSRGGASPAPRFGTACSDDDGTCANPGVISCQGNATNTTANEIWAIVGTWLPADATIGDLTFSYSFDPNLGFLGGPYTPMVTVDLDLPDYQFVSPLGALATAAGAAVAPVGNDFDYPDFSVSLPAEDLALGDSG